LAILHGKGIASKIKYTFSFPLTKKERRVVHKRAMKLGDMDASPIEGWMDIDELEWLHDTAVNMNTVVEIGAWKGRSTTALLQGCKGIVFAVDPWRGYQDNYREFIYNTAEFSHLAIFKMPSVRAATIFNGAPVDMVFIDADHSYESVKNDIEAWLPKTKKIICGHDYGDPLSPGVKQAVDEKFNDVRWINSIWYKNL